MIKIKHGLCKDCNDGIEKPVIAGRCTGKHYWQHIKMKSYNKKKERSKLISVAYGTDKKQSELMMWFTKKMHDCYAVCDNCGQRADWLKQKKYEKLWHSCQAHVLPKSLFPSVATHPDNHMVLLSAMTGVCSCHDRFDSSWDAASKMTVFKTAYEKFKLIEPFIAQEERRRIPEQFLNYNFNE